MLVMLQEEPKWGKLKVRFGDHFFWKHIESSILGRWGRRRDVKGSA